MNTKEHTNPQIQFVSRASDKLSNNAILVAGSAHVHHILTEKKLNPINPDDLLGDAGKRVIMETVGEVYSVLSDRLLTTAVDRSLHDCMAAWGVKTGFSALARQKVEDELSGNTGGSLPENSTQTMDARLSRLLNSEEIADLSKRSKSRYALFHEDYIFDFSSQSGRKFAQGASSCISVRPVVGSKKRSHLQRQIRNGLQFLKRFSSGQRIRYFLETHHPTGIMSVLDHTLEAQLISIVQPRVVHAIIDSLVEFELQYLLARESMKSFINRVAKKPLEARFNNVGSPELAGFGSALAEQRIPIHFKSHGCMVAHGAEPRSSIARLLSRSVYNEPSWASSLEPRSILQISEQEARKKIISKPRVVGLGERKLSPATRQFRIFYAPNFLSWHACYHGMSSSCYETSFCIQKLAEAVAKLRGVELYLRLKTTTKDEAKRGIWSLDRGLLPNDVKKWIDPAKGVHDSSFGSHEWQIQSSDLVVTEGITAVVFEALEHRKPVLLLTPHKSRAPSLPSVYLSEAGSLIQKSAVYYCSAEDDLVRSINMLRNLHYNDELTDSELTNYIWTSAQ
ncbi:MAG: hypothetical protein JJ891_12905 [Rhizobiaceae bacterium]|nr:hypothetical protein [Rhizobiaceae bacterium]